jgi:SAM-dependent methyltransferase
LPYYKPLLSPAARIARRVWYSVAYRGTGVVCPICEREFKRFVETVTGRCPGCGCPQHARLVWIYLREQRPELLTGSTSILQIGPDAGTERRLRKLPGIRYLSGDPYEPEAMIRLDLTNLDLPDECIDLIICVHVLGHIFNDRKAMREIRRVLRPGGTALITTPSRDDLEKTHEDPYTRKPDARRSVFGAWDLVRVYGRDFVDRLKEAGLTVEVVRPASTFDDARRKAYGVTKDRIYVCRRPKE